MLHKLYLCGQTQPKRDKFFSFNISSFLTVYLLFCLSVVLWLNNVGFPQNVQSAKISRTVQEILVFCSTGGRLFTDDNSKHKADALDDGWVLDCEQTGVEESETGSE